MSNNVLKIAVVVCLVGDTLLLPVMISTLFSNLASVDALHDKNTSSQIWYNEALFWNPRNAMAYGNLAYLYAQDDRHLDALLAARMAVSLAPDNKMFRFHLANLFDSSGQIDAAGEEWLQAQAEPFFFLKNDFARLAAIYAAKMHKSDTTFDTRVSLAFLYILAGTSEKAVAVLGVDEPLASDEEQIRQYELGAASIMLGRMQEATKHFRMAQALESVGSRNQVSDSELCDAETIHESILAAGRTSFPSYRMIRNRIPGFDKGLCLLVIDFYLGNLDIPSASKELSAATSHYGNDPRILYRLAELQLRLGNPLVAEQYLERALDTVRDSSRSNLSAQELAGFCKSLAEAHQATKRIKEIRPECK